MKFIVLKHSNKYSLTINNKYIYLIEDNWDDYTYKTTYDVFVFNENNRKIYLGKVKIGNIHMQERQRVNLPKEFSELSEEYFSIGQDADYYEKLKLLSEDSRKEYYIALRDIAYNNEILEQNKELHVMKKSLLRDININTAKYQFHRISHGGEKQVPYEFKYEENIGQENYFALDFKITPDSLPEDNIHIIIGRNGVGKTRLIKNIISTILNKEELNKKSYRHINFVKNDIKNEEFSEILHISFSAFDSDLQFQNDNFYKIGLAKSELADPIEKIFSESFLSVTNGQRKESLKQVIDILNYDYLFQESEINSYLDADFAQNVNTEKLISTFKKMSSGHKIILLSLVQLVQKVQEKTLVFIDEPEGHLHPPLLAAFIRALSLILREYNGAAIIATHSPVILQEVPSSCVWKLVRHGKYTTPERPRIETFGEDVSTLLSDIFGLEIEKSGFRKVLTNLVDKNPNCSYNEILDKLNGRLGSEGRFLLQTLIYLKKKD